MRGGGGKPNGNYRDSKGEVGKDSAFNSGQRWILQQNDTDSALSKHTIATPTHSLVALVLQYYFAQNMALVIVGAYTLDDLQKLVLRCFTDIPAEPRMEQKRSLTFRNAGTWEQTLNTEMTELGLPFTESSLCKIYRMIPIRERHTLVITWQIPSQIRLWRSKPYDYISHLLGHEAQGSVLSDLKAKLWATACTAGINGEGLEFASSHALFSMSLSLSEVGMDHWQEIVGIVYEYLGMLRHHCANGGLPRWIFDELRLTNEVAYKYSDDESPSDLVEQLADRLSPHLRYTPERLLDGQDLLFEHDDDAVQDLLDNYITPRNARVDIMSSKFGKPVDLPVTDNENNSNSNSNSNDGGEKQTESVNGKDASVTNADHSVPIDSTDGRFDPENAELPSVVPMFEAQYWVRSIPVDLLKQWESRHEPKEPQSGSSLALPPINPFVPTQFDLKPLPPDDDSHPLLNASLKLCISVGKQKVCRLVHRWPPFPLHFSKKRKKHSH